MKINQVSGLLTEGWNDDRLTLLERKHIVPFVNDIEQIVVEANLTSRQINRLFVSAAKNADASGKNRTTIGKAKDLSALVNKKIDQLGSEIKKAGPVQNIDAKFNDLKTKINMTDNKVAQGFRKVSDWAKDNPGKASVAVAVLTAAAALSAGPAGGAVAGFLSRATKDLLQGSELSSAVGKAAKMGALAGLAGLGIQGIGETLGDALKVANDTINPQYQTVELSYQEINNVAPNDWAEAKLVGLPQDVDPIRESWKEATEALSNNDYEAFEAAWAEVSAGVDELNKPEYVQSLEGDAEDHKEWLEGIAAFSKMVDGVAAAAQGSIQASGNKKESRDLTGQQVETILEWCEDTPSVLVEGPMDTIKQGVKKGARAVGKKARQVGKNMTTKVTADKLQKAWKKAGSPTDSDAVAKVLRSAGVADDVIQPIFKQMGVKLPPAGQAQQQTPQGKQQDQQPSDFNAIKSQVAKLSPEEAKELEQYVNTLLSKKTGQQPQQSQQQQAEPQPQGQQQKQQPQQQQKADPKNAAQSDTYEKAKSEIRNVQGGQKPMPPKTAAAINDALSKLSKGDKEHGVWAAEKILKFAKAGVDVSKQKQDWIANAKAAKRFLSQSFYYEISKMLREHNLSWADLGLRVHLLESTNKFIGISQIG